VLNRPPAKPFEDVRELGALIKQIGPGQHHVGLLYKLGQEIRFVHLAWHYRLLSQEPTPDYFWVQSGLDETNRRVIAPAVAQVGSEQQLPVPYSPHYEGIYFENGTLRYTQTAPGEGLTCATFIMAVFEALGFPLVNVREWPVRAEDASWFTYIVSRLENDATEEHIEAIRANPNGTRFRPEEVVGTVTEGELPVPFARAEALGQEILVEILQAAEASRSGGSGS
jgi:hypothetical protein